MEWNSFFTGLTFNVWSGLAPRIHIDLPWEQGEFPSFIRIVTGYTIKDLRIRHERRDFILYCMKANCEITPYVKEMSSSLYSSKIMDQNKTNSERNENMGSLDFTTISVTATFFQWGTDWCFNSFKNQKFEWPRVCALKCKIFKSDDSHYSFLSCVSAQDVWE